MATGTTSGKCRCCKYTCNACPGGVNKLPPSFTVTLSGIAAGSYGYNVLNKTWTVTYDAAIAIWIYQTSNPPFLVPYNYGFSGGGGSYGAYGTVLNPTTDKGDLVTVYCHTDITGTIKKLTLFAGVFDNDQVGFTPPFISYYRSCRWVIYDFVISSPNTCSPLFIQQTTSAQLNYNDAWPGFGPIQISTQSPTLTISP